MRGTLAKATGRVYTARVRARNFCVYWLPVLVWAGMISLFSTAWFSSGQTSGVLEKLVRLFWPTISAETFALWHHVVRKAAHVTEYMILSLLLFRALRGGLAIRWKASWFWICMVTIVVYAALDEFHQSFVPGREACVTDVGYDVLGGLLGQLWCWTSSRFAARKA